ncbi:MAG: hypothetical protein AAFQ89_21735 [Cyanobacteria bacterium J06626_18]
MAFKFDFNSDSADGSGISLVSMNHLRQWQKDAIAHCLRSSKQVFVCMASPATGKTLFGLTLTQRL